MVHPCLGLGGCNGRGGTPRGRPSVELETVRSAVPVGGVSSGSGRLAMARLRKTVVVSSTLCGHSDEM
eukprot:4876532-Prymnesium_polylepis.1